jgi:hypothetical protein
MNAEQALHVLETYHSFNRWVRRMIDGFVKKIKTQGELKAFRTEFDNFSERVRGMGITMYADLDELREAIKVIGCSDDVIVETIDSCDDIIKFADYHDKVRKMLEHYKKDYRYFGLVFSTPQMRTEFGLKETLDFP